MTIQVIDRQGRAQEWTPSLDAYKAAFSKGLTLPQFLNATMDTDAEKFGTPFEQILASSGIYLREDRKLGLRPPKMTELLNGDIDINMGVVSAPDGANRLTVAGRFLFPAVIIEMVESQLREDNAGYAAVYNQMVATTTSVDSPRFDQPIINLTAPRAIRSKPIAQGAEPAAMVSISLSDANFKLPTFSIGIEITDEAARASTLDLVGIALREQSEAERAAIIDENIVAMVLGDTDRGISALTAVNADTFDSTISADGVITNRAWLKWLSQSYKTMAIDWAITDIDTYLAIEGRTGRPLAQNNSAGTELLNTIPAAVNSGLPGVVKFFLVDVSLLGANTVIGIDSRKAIRKVVYAGAAYSAIEQFVMRRTTALRVDFSESSFRLIDGAWKRLHLINT